VIWGRSGHDSSVAKPILADAAWALPNFAQGTLELMPF
jgi:hypothetical protein